MLAVECKSHAWLLNKLSAIASDSANWLGFIFAKATSEPNIDVAVEAALVSNVVAVVACAAADETPITASAGKATVASAEMMSLV